MKTALKVFRVLFEITGGLAIVLCAWIYHAFVGNARMRNPCTYRQEGAVASPDGKMIADKQVEACPYGTWVQIRLGTEGDESMDYEKIVTLQKVEPAQIQLLWTASRELQVSLPRSAALLDAHSYHWGVTIQRTTRD